MSTYTFQRTPFGTRSRLFWRESICLPLGYWRTTVRYFNPNRSLPLDAFAVFLSLTVLGVLLLSNRLRRRLRLFVSEHFRRPVYDYRAVWMEVDAEDCFGRKRRRTEFRGEQTRIRIS